MRSLFLLLTLLAATANAAVDAVIQGPSEAFVGDLIVLNSGASVGDNKVWIVDPAASGKTIECADTLAFAVGTPGRYEFTLVVADKEADIDYDRFVVNVRPQGTTPPPVDPKPTDPPPVVTPPDLLALTELSRNKSAAMSDNATATALAEAIKAAIAQSATKPLSEARVAFGAAFEATMLARTGASRDKDWLRGWRIPVNEAIDKAAPADTASYIAMIGAIEKGLRPVLANAQESKVVLYTRAGCVYCDRWKSLVMPALIKAGWKIEVVDGHKGTVPMFDVCTRGKCVQHTGYLDMNTFNRIVESL